MKRVGIFVCVFGAVLLAGCSCFRTAVRGRGPAGVRVSETLVHSFAGWPADGYIPDTALVMDTAGNFYGTTANGCGNCEGLPHGDAGAVFRLSPSGRESVLYSFRGGRRDGENPVVDLIMDAAGNLYGTTSRGGAHDCGIVFKLTRSGTESVLYSFAGFMGGYPEGNTASALLMDADGNLYGTTRYGGSGNCKDGCGTVFKLTPSGAMEVLHSFAGFPADGSDPRAGLIIDVAGNLYGTTSEGGASGHGTVFKITAAGAESILYSFGGPPVDGDYPASRLIMDPAGNLYGTTWFGGSHNEGTVFKLTPLRVQSVLHSFAGGLIDGVYPIAGLIMDAAGSLYGTTSKGGASGHGTVFKISSAGAESVLYSFAGPPVDGNYPVAGLTMDSNGNLYGTTSAGGAQHWGAVFEIKY